MNVTDLRAKDVAQLQSELEALMKERFNLRMQLGSGQDVKPHNFTRVRRDIARVKTVITEKNKQAG